MRRNPIASGPKSVAIPTADAARFRREGSDLKFCPSTRENGGNRQRHAAVGLTPYARPRKERKARRGVADRRYPALAVAVAVAAVAAAAAAAPTDAR